MMKSTTILVLSLLLFVLTLPRALAQGIPEKIAADSLRAPSLKALEKKAKSSFDNGDYGASIKYYERIIARDEKNAAAWSGLADAAIAYTNYQKAAQALEFLRENQLVDLDAPFLLKLADVRYFLREDSVALELYQQADGIATSADLKNAAKNGVKNSKWAIEVMKNPEQIQSFQLDSLNTEYAEYANVWLDKHYQLYYSSFSQPYKGDSSRHVLQLMTAQTRPEGRVDYRLSPLNVPDHHTAYICFNEDHSAVYYAVGDYNKDKQIFFELYRRKQLSDGVWGEPEKLPDYINLRKSSTSQPSFGKLPGETAETLFFVSDRPGGKGKKDIWYCKLEGDVFSQPENLNMLNTEEDELSPFYHAPSGVLYFSSTGRQSLGGFDIYRSDRRGQLWETPTHLPAPFNSPANDIFYSLSEDGNIVFFSTNRSGTQQFSDDDCCYDIYQYCKPQQMNVAVCNEETGEMLDFATIRQGIAGSAAPETLDPVELSGSSYSFPFQPNTNYQVTVSKPGFHSKTVVLTSPLSNCFAKLDTICLLPVQVDLIVNIVDCEPSIPFKGATLTLSNTDPNGAVVTRNDPDSSVYHFKLAPEQNYTLKANSGRITTDADPVSTKGFDRDTTIRRELRLGRSLDLTVELLYNLEGRPTPLYDVIVTLLEWKNGAWQVSKKENIGPGSNQFSTAIEYGVKYQITAEKHTEEITSPDVSLDRCAEYRKAGFTLSPDTVKSDFIGLFEIEPVVFAPDEPCKLISKSLFLKKIPNLPITLYFDNDEPGPHTSSDKIPLRYISYKEFQAGRLKNDTFGYFYFDGQREGLFGKRSETYGAYIPLNYQDIYLGYNPEQPLQQYSCHPDLGHKCNGNRHHCLINPTTGKSYSDPGISITGYYNLKSTFIEKFTQGASAATKDSLSLQVCEFFEDRVRGEWDRLRDVFASTEEILADSTVKRVTIEIQGYASPLGKGPYNLTLTSRRVNSAVQFFQFFDGGVFMPYINSGKLVLRRVPNGASNILPKAYGDSSNRRLSVYSAEASLERRIEIVNLEVEYNE